MSPNPTFVEPQHTRRKVKAAGEVLRGEDLSIEAFTHALSVVQNWRAAHRYILNLYNTRLRKTLKRHGIDAVVSSRLKRTPSIINKLKRIPRMNLARMGDIAGMRIVVKSPSDLYRLIDLLDKGKTKQETAKISNYIAIPKATGYRSMHYILKHQGDGNTAFDGLSIELQIRTEMQHAWATSVEIIDSFLGKSLKTTIHNTKDKHSEFFKLASSIMADKEFLPRSEEHSPLSFASMVKSAIQLDDKLQVCDNLDAFRIALPAKKTGSRAYYRILELDRKNKHILIYSYAKTDFDHANECYASLEIKYKDNVEKDVVFVQSGSIEEVKKAYPNYFGGADVMIQLFRELRRIVLP